MGQKPGKQPKDPDTGAQASSREFWDNKYNRSDDRPMPYLANRSRCNEIPEGGNQKNDDGNYTAGVERGSV